jgi:hypothetical protein
MINSNINEKYLRVISYKLYDILLIFYLFTKFIYKHRFLIYKFKI